MKIAGIHLARFFAFVDIVDLNPRGKAYFPDLVKAVVQRYHFAKFPQKIEDFDESKGITFQGGRTEDFTIDQIVVFEHAIYVDTSTSTEASQNLLIEMLSWLAKDNGLTFEPRLITRCTYVSQLTFFSDSMTKAFSPALIRLSEKLNKRVPEYYRQPLNYVPNGFLLSYDPLSIKAGPSNFSIERRADVLYSENKYFSSAPLPTNEHIALLEELEKEL